MSPCSQTGNHFLALFPCEESEAEGGQGYEVQRSEAEGSLRGTKPSLRGRVWRRLSEGLFRRPGGKAPRGGFLRTLGRTHSSQLVQIRKH